MSEASRKAEEVLPFCGTDRQRKILETLIETKNVAHTAKKFGVVPGTVHAALKQVTKNAAKRGFSPEHDCHHGVPDGFVAKGVSTLYGDDGEVRAQWVKSEVDKERQQALMEEGFAAMAKTLKPVKSIKLERRGQIKELLNLFVLTDAHLGMLAWKKETGADWNLSLAVETVEQAMVMAMDCSPPAETCVIAQIGDFFHSDSLKALTPESGHVLDQDSRFSKIVASGVQLLRRIVEEALRRHNRVELILGEGNHDPVSSIFLRVMFLELYKKQKRLRVDDTELPYYVLRHGKTMLGFHHGHKKGVDGKSGSDLALLFADTPEWAESRHRYIHTGHLHNEKVNEVTGAHLQQHATLAAPDAYAARGGWKSKRAMRTLCYHSEYGEVGGNRVTPEMLEPADAD